MKGYTDKDYRYCYRYATIAIVGENLKFFLGLRPVRTDEDHVHGRIMEDLVDRARQMVSIGTVYADRAYATADVLDVLNQRPVNYAIPTRIEKRIKPDIPRMAHDVEVTPDYGVNGDVRGGGTKERVETTRVLLPSTKGEDDEQEVVAFYTNLEVTDESESDRRRTERVINRYRRRWDIENAFKSVKTFLPWTTSNEPDVRLFHFAFGMLLYNLWRLIDFLIQKSLEGREQRTEPRLKAKRFINAIEARKLLE